MSRKGRNSVWDFRVSVQQTKSVPFLGCRGWEPKGQKRAVGGRGEEKACSALLQNSKQKNSVVVQCVANYDHAKSFFCLVSCGGLQWFISMWREAKDIPPLFQTSCTFLGPVPAGPSSLALPTALGWARMQGTWVLPQVWLIQLCRPGQTQWWKLLPLLPPSP